MNDTKETDLLRGNGWLDGIDILADWANRCHGRGYLIGPGIGLATASPALRSRNIIDPRVRPSEDGDELRWLTGADGEPRIDLAIPIQALRRQAAVNLLAAVAREHGREIVELPREHIHIYDPAGLDPDAYPETYDPDELKGPGVFTFCLSASTRLDAIELARRWGRLDNRTLAALVRLCDWGNIEPNRVIPGPPMGLPQPIGDIERIKRSPDAYRLARTEPINDGDSYRRALEQTLPSDAVESEVSALDLLVRCEAAIEPKDLAAGRWLANPKTYRRSDWRPLDADLGGRVIKGPWPGGVADRVGFRRAQLMRDVLVAGADRDTPVRTLRVLGMGEIEAMIDRGELPGKGDVPTVPNELPEATPTEDWAKVEDLMPAE
ncbi:hypothetical protein [Bifidobacterium bifidum]|uniref:hypothetical protein n=1 Tax=Bifidobacterium bifidum TaxID=1681 RepID=UPI0022E52782|nr:hypothetical protein [Bifidobacterium bifidum]